MRKYGLRNFTFEVLYEGEYNESIEEKFVKLYDSFNNGYNKTSDGKFSSSQKANTGRIIVNNGEHEHFIRPSELEEYLEKGYVRGRNPNTYVLSRKDVQEKQRKSRTKNGTWNKRIEWCHSESSNKKRATPYVYDMGNGLVRITTRCVAARKCNSHLKCLGKYGEVDLTNLRIYQPQRLSRKGVRSSERKC